MKDPRKYLKQANIGYRCNRTMEDEFVNEKAALKAIEQAQKDAWNAALEAAAEYSDSIGKQSILKLKK